MSKQWNQCVKGHRLSNNRDRDGRCSVCRRDRAKKYRTAKRTSIGFMPIPNGTVFNDWTVLEYAKLGNYKCRCICGAIGHKIPGRDLISGKRRACRGCMAGGSQEKTLFNQLISRYKFSASRFGRSFELTDDQALLFFKADCSYCGKLPSSFVKPSRKNVRLGFPYNGIDRVDNTIGYTPNNCVTCCKICNHMKHILTEEEFLAHVKQICEHRRLV
jgi:hypothetical protein